MIKTSPEQYGGGRPYSKPYTQAGIERLLCSYAGCGLRAYAAWGACSDDNLHRPMCPEHDMACNVAALRMAGDPEASEKLWAYRCQLEEAIGRPLDNAVIQAALRRVAPSG